jgi:hypothetical protein
LLQLYRNLTNTLTQLQRMRNKDLADKDSSNGYYDDNSNAW